MTVSTGPGWEMLFTIPIFNYEYGALRLISLSFITKIRLKQEKYQIVTNCKYYFKNASNCGIMPNRIE